MYYNHKKTRCEKYFYLFPLMIFSLAIFNYVNNQYFYKEMNNKLSSIENNQLLILQYMNLTNI